MGFDKNKFALMMRDLISEIARKEIDKQRPRYRYGSIFSIDRARYSVQVVYPGETDPITVRMGSIQPAYVGQIVRIEGSRSERYVSDVIGPCFRDDLLGSAADNATPVTLTNNGTTDIYIASPIVPFTVVPDMARIEITASARYVLGSATAGRMSMWAGYDDGALALNAGDIISGTCVRGLEFASVPVSVTGALGTASGIVISDFLLPAGNYQAFGACKRDINGDPTDTVSDGWVRVKVIGTE